MKILGPNDTGRGILLEYDAGYVSYEDNKKIISEMRDMDFSQDIVLYAVLQKYDTPNKNGRIYPELLLKRENEKYQTLIKKGGALNELNHPSCHTGDVDILTHNGWKNIKEVDEFEKIVTLNNVGIMEEKNIYSSVKHHHKGKMFRFSGKNIDTLVTPNHKFPIKKGNKLKFITAQEIFESFKKGNALSNYYIPKTGTIKNIEKQNYFILKGLDESEFENRCGETTKLKYMSDIKIPMDVFMSFMGVYLAEGHVGLSKINLRKTGRILSNGQYETYESSDNGYVVGVSQKKTETIFLIEELLSMLPFDFKKYVKKDGTTSFIINDRRLWKYLRKLGKSNEKYVPTELKNTSPTEMEFLLKWFHLGDGRTIGKYAQSDVFSTSEQLINDLQELLILSGNSGNIRKEKRNKDRYIDNRLIKGENTKDMFFLNISKTKGIYLDSRFLNVTEEDYEGYVYSVDVPNHNYYVRSNGKCHWTGNSSLIDLDRVSHSILETWWDGKILMGKIKLFTSPAWKKMGIVSTKGDQAAMLIMNGATLGISSRGVGSLKNVKGQNIVQDDFELVCFDLVSSPSTPGAYIFSDINDREQYQESLNEKPKDFDKMKNLMSKLDNFLSK